MLSSVSYIGYAAVMSNPRKKVEVCKDIEAIALIDDSIGHITECVEAGMQGILFGDYPWNQTEELSSGIVRCSNWPEVLEYFDRQR